MLIYYLPYSLTGMVSNQTTPKTVQVQSDTKNELADLKRGSDTFDHVIRRLLEAYN